MPTRPISFAPGPAMLPPDVIAEHQRSMCSYADTGLGICELGHRSRQFADLLDNTRHLIRSLLAVPDTHDILLLHGGARMQFAMLPANLLPAHGCADYIETGHFARDAAAEAGSYGQVHTAASTTADGFRRLPTSYSFSTNPRYVHYTSNNTEMGTQFRTPPPAPRAAWLACDASSDLLTRPFDLAAHGCVYATSHKNLGTAGLAVVIIRADLLNPVRDLPTYLRYATHARSQSCYNTPPIAVIHIMNLMLRWTASNGAVTGMARQSQAKADMIYAAIDDSDFYTGLADHDSRSLVNVTFAVPTPQLETRFQEEAAAAGLIGLWGYRKVGHLRASLFNAVPVAACERLADFMTSFAAKHRRHVHVGRAHHVEG